MSLYPGSVQLRGDAGNVLEQLAARAMEVEPRGMAPLAWGHGAGRGYEAWVITSRRPPGSCCSRRLVAAQRDRRASARPGTAKTGASAGDGRSPPCPVRPEAGSLPLPGG